MRTEIFASAALLAAILASGCSSLPWSSSAPAVDPTAEALYQDGMRYMKEKRYVRALDAFTKLKSEHPFSPLLADTELKIADAYYLNEQYSEAVNAFKEFQTAHPTSEHIPFVILRLGQAHFNQFSNINRDQKNTEIAKGYFEAVLSNHPKSPHATEAREKLAKCNGILAEHEFNIADFYFKQEKYPAARDRFEEIVRKYPGTPVAAKSLFFLGQSYRREKNNVKAALAFEALLSHYPEDQLAAPARTQLAQMENEKHDPLAMLLMRDRRVAPNSVEAKQESTATVKTKEVTNLVAKTEVVYEAPAGEKTMFRRVVNKINPFSSSGSDKKDEEIKKQEVKTKSAVELLAKNNNANTESKGFFASLWPFGGSARTNGQQASGKGSRVIDSVDESLKENGIDAKAKSAALKPPPADLPKVDEPERKPPADTAKLLEQIDATLKKEGKDASGVTPPEAAAAFRDPAVARAAVAKAQPKTASGQSSATADLIGSIDQKLQGKGVAAGNFEPPPSGEVVESKPATPREINLEPKVAEKGPLFLSPADAPAIQQVAPDDGANANAAKPEAGVKSTEPAAPNMSRTLVPAPQQPATAAKADDQKRAKSNEETKGALEQLQHDLDSVGKILNPFRW